jgi:hypothetical protein
LLFNSTLILCRCPCYPGSDGGVFSGGAVTVAAVIITGIRSLINLVCGGK